VASIGQASRALDRDVSGDFWVDRGRVARRQVPRENPALRGRFQPGAIVARRCATVVGR
jgi:hypothetical protein